jgi:hypothetical protein
VLDPSIFMIAVLMVRPALGTAIHWIRWPSRSLVLAHGGFARLMCATRPNATSPTARPIFVQSLGNLPG